MAEHDDPQHNDFKPGATGHGDPRIGGSGNTDGAKPERDRAEDNKGDTQGRDVPPARRRDPNSPWMGGG